MLKKMGALFSTPDPMKEFVALTNDFKRSWKMTPAEDTSELALIRKRYHDKTNKMLQIFEKRYKSDYYIELQKKLRVAIETVLKKADTDLFSLVISECVALMDSFEMSNSQFLYTPIELALKRDEYNNKMKTKLEIFNVIKIESLSGQDKKTLERAKALHEMLLKNVDTLIKKKNQKPPSPKKQHYTRKELTREPPEELVKKIICPAALQTQSNKDNDICKSDPDKLNKKANDKDKEKKCETYAKEKLEVLIIRCKDNKKDNKKFVKVLDEYKLGGAII